MRGLILVVATTAAILLAAPASAAIDRATASAAGDAIPRLYKNCTNLNTRYRHGVGRRLARDKTSGDPVTNFKRSTALYNTAMGYNRGLDRDKDGIACEKLCGLHDAQFHLLVERKARRRAETFLVWFGGSVFLALAGWGAVSAAQYAGPSGSSLIGRPDRSGPR